MLEPTVLLTGFEPFNNASINPSAEVVKLLRDENQKAFQLHTCILPVMTDAAPEILRQHLDRLRPDFMIGLGEARGRSAISIEQVGINELDFSIPDNGGNIIRERPIIEGGPNFYTSSLATVTVRDTIRKYGIPAVLSDSAGRYLCNQIFYVSLHWASLCSPNTQVGRRHHVATSAHAGDMTARLDSWG
ncbi:MAG: pyroglutamyl-peptidase I, partial [Chloroflexota bacterium]